MKSLISFFFCISLTLSSNAQVINGIVCDRSNKEPVPFVSVFVESSSIGTQTDLHGHFTLNISGVGDLNVVFSHLNYKLTEYNSEHPNDTIWLEAKDYHLDEMVVAAKRKDKFRKNRLKRFKDAFLGERRDKKLVKLLNEKVLLFDEDNGLLEAFAKEPLIVKNQYLGYLIHFHLEEFELTFDEELRFKGKIFFKPMEGSKKEMALHKRNRIKTYKKSSNNFFKKLIAKDINQDLYEVGYASIKKNGEIIQYVPTAVDSIRIKDIGAGKFEIPVRSSFAVVHNDMVLPHQVSSNLRPSVNLKNLKKKTIRKATSIFKARNAMLVLNKYGRIVNSMEITEYGHWANSRLDKMLPLDFTYNN